MSDQMSVVEAQRYLKSRSEVVFDRAGGQRTKISWSARDAHAARVVLYELARLQREAAA